MRQVFDAATCRPSGRRVGFALLGARVRPIRSATTTLSSPPFGLLKIVACRCCCCCCRFGANLSKAGQRPSAWTKEHVHLLLCCSCARESTRAPICAICPMIGLAELASRGSAELESPLKARRKVAAAEATTATSGPSIRPRALGHQFVCARDSNRLVQAPPVAGRTLAGLGCTARN